MTNHDFRSLNDKDFEALCVDLIGDSEGVRMERFKPGKDGGVDGRFFSPDSGEVVLQCKHHPGSSFQSLFRMLKKHEIPTLKKLQPNRYLFAVSIPLSRANKKRLSDLFSPFVISDADIFGSEDLNDLIARSPAVERRHYKLWIRSAGVLANLLNNAIIGRSRFAVEEMHRNADRYVTTESHKAALETVEALGVVLLTGEPGVGKTTLAEQICLTYVAEGFELVQIMDEVRDGESAFQSGTKQIFYFDDFLGRNYLDAVRKNEGAAIMQFIRRVAADRTKRMVITSRSGIMSQGRLLMDLLNTPQAKRNEFELRISSLSLLDKGRILYQHVWSSGLSTEHVEEIYADKRYRRIVQHKNFNPRLISFITDPARIDSAATENYWGFVQASLDNPSEIWAYAFDAQLDDFGRAIVFLVVVAGRRIQESDLNAAYRRYISMPQHSAFKGRQDFGLSLRVLVGSFLNRDVADSGAKIDLFNPSVGDFVLMRLKEDVDSLLSSVIALRSEAAIVSVSGMERNGIISHQRLSGLLAAALLTESANEFSGSDASYLSCIFAAAESRVPALLKTDSNFSEAVGVVATSQSAYVSSDILDFIRWGVDGGSLDHSAALIWGV